MPAPFNRRGAAGRHWLVIAASLMLAVIGSSALADTRPLNAADPRTPVTVSADSLPTVQINGVVWQQTIIGTTVYAAGSFSKARPAGAALGTSEVTRNNLLAFDLVSGVLNTSFVPNLNGQVKAVTASPDGSRLYVGGDFTAVNGVPRSRVAALNPTTGAVLTDFAPQPNAQVKAIVATATNVFLGGSFSKIGTSVRTKVAAVTPTGAVRSQFHPDVADGTVHALIVSPDHSMLVLGGSFTALNGSSNPGYGLGAVDPTTGASKPFAVNSVVRNAGANASILSLAADATAVYGSGYGYGSKTLFEGVFAANWSDTKLKWIEDCHGDSYGVYASSTALYVAGHAHFCGNVAGFGETDPRSYHHALAFSRAATGLVQRNLITDHANFGGQPAPSLLTWFPDFNNGTYTGQSQGPWTVTGSDKYVVYGGEFTQVNGAGQQGLARFVTSDLAPNQQGPRANGTGFTPVVSSAGSRAVTVTWPANYDRDNENLTYQVLQDNVVIHTTSAASTFWNRPTLSHTATGVSVGTHTYKVRALDPFGTLVGSPTVSFTAT